MSRSRLRSLHWEYSPLGGSLEKTEHLSSSLIHLEIPDYLLKHCRCSAMNSLSLKTNENAVSRTTLCVLGGNREDVWEEKSKVRKTI